MNDLASRKCQSCEGGIPSLEASKAQELLKQLDGWMLNDASTEVSRKFSFKDFYQTMGFVNAVAWIANLEGHHPDLEVSYDSCLVHFSTHAIGGLSENDFICAAKVDALMSES